MRKIIKDKVIVNDDWQVLKLADGEVAESINVPAGRAIVPLAVCLEK
jgi:uncharacterized protein (DUF934 family)